MRNDWRVADYQHQPIVWSNQFEAGLAQQTNGENLPRTAPYSYLTELSYRAHRWSARLSVKHVFAAKALAENEQVTDAYTWASAYVDWQPKTQYGDWKIWLKAENVLDDYAQNHLSFLKETAPLMGASVSAGVRWLY
ncbi:hypothetical protein THIOSC15_980002 [uncultured Thiomicrorhabdus sp.]